MLITANGIRISLLMIALCGVFFYFNKRPKFLVPLQQMKQRSRFVYTILLCILTISIVLLPLRISIVTDKHVVVEKNLPIQILLDVSLSMSANDIAPSRFVAAKKSLISLAQKLDGYYISLIAFSGKPFVYMPFSSSSSAIVTKLSAMNLGDFPPVKDFLGTAIGDALLLAANNLQQFTQQETYKPGIVILITDGDSNIGYDPLQVIAYYQKTHVPLYVLGVGQENYLIGRDSRDDDVTTNINLPLLQKLSDKTGGKFYRVLGDQSFNQFLIELSENIVSQQQKKIQNILWELNDYLIYIIIFSLFGVLIFRILSFSSLLKK